jgi:hypothetical protein
MLILKFLQIINSNIIENESIRASAIYEIFNILSPKFWQYAHDQMHLMKKKDKEEIICNKLDFNTRPIDALLISEEAIWRAKSYEEIEAILDDVQYYEIVRDKVNCEIEVHTKKGKKQNEIIVMIECSRLSFGKAKYFVCSKESGVRDIESDEAF